MRFSVVIPAHQEERLIGRALASIAAAAAPVQGGVEVVVALDRCRDATRAIAEAAGARTVDASGPIAAIRNAGAEVAVGEVLVTMDADCVMHPQALAEVDRLLRAGRHVGGGTLVRPERTSVGIRATYALVSVLTTVTRLSGGMFWCLRADFEAIGGFDETLVVGEDLDLARRLRTHGRRSGRSLTMIRAAPLTASCRKFDRFGDWHMFAMALQLRQIRASLRGTDTTWLDRNWTGFNDADTTPEM